MKPRPPRPSQSSAARLALALLAVLGAAACERAEAPTQPAAGPHVILVTLDTTRWDRLSVYGYARPTSPELERLAEESVVYTRAYSTSSWTLPAHASLFTGRLTVSHGARYDPQGPLVLTEALEKGGGALEQYRARGLTPEAETLAGLLGEAGYTTGGVVAGPWMKRIFGLDAGFEHYDDAGIDAMNGRRAGDVTDAAVEWIDAHAGERLFLFLNYYDPHGPYRPPEGWAERFAPASADERALPPKVARRALYDGEIAYMDSELGRLLDHLRRRGLYRRSWVVVTSDHGELFGEHGLKGHGRLLYEPEIHVPLLVKPPGGARPPRREDALVQITDVMPALLRALEIETPPEVQGRPLGRRGDAPVVAELYPLPLRGDRGNARALVRERYKLIWNERGYHRLYDLEEDPGETRNLVVREPERTEALRAELESYVAKLPRPRRGGPERRIDPETREALEGLGYIEE